MGVDIFSGSSPGRHIYTNRCAWSLEIVRRHAGVMEIDNQIFAAAEAARARQLAEARYSEQRRQALAAILYGVVIMILVIAAAGG